MPNPQTIYCLAVVVSVYMALIAALVFHYLQRPLANTPRLIKWLILVLVAVYLSLLFGLDGWRAISALLR